MNDFSNSPIWYHRGNSLCFGENSDFFFYLCSFLAASFMAESSTYDSSEPVSFRNNSNVTIDVSQNPSSPYYLHLDENLGSTLVSPPLNGPNYYTWSRAMRRALISKNKLKFVDGTISAPNRNDPLYEAWERCNVMIVSWITRTLIPQIAQSPIRIDNEKSYGIL